MKAGGVIAATVLAALFAAGCGNNSNSTASVRRGSGRTKCNAQIGIEGPFTGAAATMGQDQLHFAELAVAMDNKASKTNIALVKGDTQLNPVQATTVTQQFTSESAIVAVVGPAGSQEVQAVGPLMTSAGMPFISGSAMSPTLTAGGIPTFFRVVSEDSVQGQQDAKYIVSHLRPKALMIIDDQEADSTGLVAAMTPVFKAAGIKVDHESVSQQVTNFSSLVAKVTPAMTVVVLPWQVAANAEQFGRNLAARHKKAAIFAMGGLLDPRAFTIPGSYVSSPGPDIIEVPADAPIVASAMARYGPFSNFGPQAFAATHVVDEAIASVCAAGRAPSRANVLAAIRRTKEPTSILGQPISFDSHGNLVGGRFFLFKISSAGTYKLIPSS